MVLYCKYSGTEGTRIEWWNHWVEEMKFLRTWGKCSFVSTTKYCCLLCWTVHVCNCCSNFFFYILFWSLQHLLKMFAYCLMHFFFMISKEGEVYVIYMEKRGSHMVKAWDMIRITKIEKYIQNRLILKHIETKGENFFKFQRHVLRETIYQIS